MRPGRIPIRARLTAVFALATIVVLAGAALFVYVRLRDDLDESVDESLRTRALSADVVATIGDPEDEFAQLLAAGGTVTARAGRARQAALSPAETRLAARRAIYFTRRVQGIEGTARLLARPAAADARGDVVVVGRSLDDRDETLRGLLTSFAVGGPLAVLLASIAGYGLATAGLRPVEAMRRRAAEVSLSGAPTELPLPAARDEIRRLGETLNDMLERLRVAFDRERRFVADASHELRTPVAVLKTELEGALRTGDYGPTVRDALVAAVGECDHLAQLAEDLLVIARAADGHLPVRRERQLVRSLLERVKQRFTDRATQAGRRVVVDAPDDLHVDGDPLRLRQALGNLVDNALRHGAGDVVLQGRGAVGRVELTVSDGGDGIGEGLRDTAFERFTRGDDARARGGAGLGLAIVRAIAEAHGGTAEVAADDPRRVCIRLPAVAART